MNRFLRNALISCSRRNSLFPAVAVAAATAGCGLYYANRNSDSGTRISLSVPAPLLESLSLPWEITQCYTSRPSIISTDNWGFGIQSWGFSGVSPASSADVNNESSGVNGDASKPSCGCLGRDTMANAAAKVGPAVVHLSVVKLSVPLGFLGVNVATTRVWSGTIIDSDGTILTCAHSVVGSQFWSASSKRKVDVTLQDGRTFEGTMVNADLDSDIAIIKIKSKLPLPTARLGSSSKLQPGDWVLAMGCPLSHPNTVTAGIVSHVNRKGSDLGIEGKHGEFLQTDCAVNKGNSGGPLVNIDGELVGVMIRKAADGVGFAVPIDSVAKIIEHFEKSGLKSMARFSPASSADVNNESSGVIGEASKPSCGCLGRESMANAAAKVGPAVVSLRVPLGFLGITIANTIGSGTIIDSDGTILTCAHVVAGFKFLSASSKGKVDVTLQDGRTFEGTVVHADLHSDIAIVKIKSKLPLPTAKLGSSSKLRPGDWVLAIGCPLSLQNTVTAGIVSYVDRKSSDLHLGGMHGEYLQTNCAVHVGTYGGPLVNIDGELVRVYIMKGVSMDSWNIAAPIDSVAKVIEHFKKSG